MPSPKTVETTYRFYRDNGDAMAFRLTFDAKDLTLITESDRDFPDWTKLGYCQCPHCPLSKAEYAQCPVAANLVEVTDMFKEGIASEEVEVIVETPNRTYAKRAPLANGLSAMIGFINVTSGCPVLDKLRPLAYVHLPFTDMTEVVFRAMSMYLLAQFFVKHKGGVPDWDLKNFPELFEDINLLNENFSMRLEAAVSKDASLNALTKLDCFASFAAMSVEPEHLGSLENMFKAYYRNMEQASVQDFGQQSLTPSGSFQTSDLAMQDPADDFLSDLAGAIRFSDGDDDSEALDLDLDDD